MFPSKISIKGIYRITEIDCSTPEALQLERERNIPELIRRFALRTLTLENIVPNVYLTALALNMVTDSASVPAASKLRALYLALGTGTASPAAGNTQLATEVFRDTVDTQSASGAVAKNAMLLTTSEANGNTLAEVGLFAGNATSSANSGLLCSRLLISPTIAKTNAKTVFIEVTHTFADA